MGNDDELKTVVKNWLNMELTAVKFKLVIVKLLNRYDKCLNVMGDYGEVK